MDKYLASFCLPARARALFLLSLSLFFLPRWALLLASAFLISSAAAFNRCGIYEMKDIGLEYKNPYNGMLTIINK
jgi:hypothetical protein